MGRCNETMPVPERKEYSAHASPLCLVPLETWTLGGWCVEVALTCPLRLFPLHRVRQRICLFYEAHFHR